MYGRPAGRPIRMPSMDNLKCKDSYEILPCQKIPFHGENDPHPGLLPVREKEKDVFMVMNATFVP